MFLCTAPRLFGLPPLLAGALFFLTPTGCDAREIDDSRTQTTTIKYVPPDGFEDEFPDTSTIRNPRIEVQSRPDPKTPGKLPFKVVVDGGRETSAAYNVDFDRDEIQWQPRVYTMPIRDSIAEFTLLYFSPEKKAWLPAAQDAWKRKEDTLHVVRAALPVHTDLFVYAADDSGNRWIARCHGDYGPAKLQSEDGQTTAALSQWLTMPKTLKVEPHLRNASVIADSKSPEDWSLTAEFHAMCRAEKSKEQLYLHVPGYVPLMCERTRDGKLKLWWPTRNSVLKPLKVALTAGITQDYPEWMRLGKNTSAPVKFDIGGKPASVLDLPTYYSTQITQWLQAGRDIRAALNALDAADFAPPLPAGAELNYTVRSIALGEIVSRCRKDGDHQVSLPLCELKPYVFALRADSLVPLSDLRVNSERCRAAQRGKNVFCVVPGLLKQTGPRIEMVVPTYRPQTIDLRQAKFDERTKAYRVEVSLISEGLTLRFPESFKPTTEDELEVTFVPPAAVRPEFIVTEDRNSTRDVVRLELPAALADGVRTSRTSLVYSGRPLELQTKTGVDLPDDGLAEIRLVSTSSNRLPWRIDGRWFRTAVRLADSRLVPGPNTLRVPLPFGHWEDWKGGWLRVAQGGRTLLTLELSASDVTVPRPAERAPSTFMIENRGRFAVPGDAAVRLETVQAALCDELSEALGTSTHFFVLGAGDDDTGVSRLEQLGGRATALSTALRHEHDDLFERIEDVLASGGWSARPTVLVVTPDRSQRAPSGCHALRRLAAADLIRLQMLVVTGKDDRKRIARVYPGATPVVVQPRGSFREAVRKAVVHATSLANGE